MGAGAMLKMERLEMTYINAPGGPMDRLVIAETKQDFTIPRNEKYVKGWRHGCYSAGEEVSCSWRELYKHANGLYPTDQQLANMTEQQAINWFRDKYKNPCWPAGPQYASVSNSQELRQVGSPICFDYPDPLISTLPNFNDKIMPFDGEIVFPGGQKCKIEPIVWPKKPGNGQKVTIKVKAKSYCAPCMF